MTKPPTMVSRACATLLGVPAETAERLKADARSAVYRTALRDGRTVIVKLYTSTALRNALTEATAIRAAAAVVPVPEVLGRGALSDGGATALVMSDLGPLTLGSSVEAGRTSRTQALKDLGALLTRLHRAPLAASTARRPFFDSVAPLTRRCPSDLLGTIGPALAVLADTPDSAPTVWCHGDVHFDNVVLAGPARTRHLVDFTDAAPGHRESDLAHALVMTDARSPWDRAALTGAYTLAWNDTRLAAWVVLHTLSSLAHAAPGPDHALWSDRLADLARRTPHLFRPLPQKGTR
ncbi:aminoglycoside phosphotransferase family protein [Streptomyces sp. NPDC093509]|uniref:aminoglycoside phosphotransferase family protein n=1 Tax=Streptomyces sp. NPDC093509 TaxID=3154982 RepID=UPI00344CEA85